MTFKLKFVVLLMIFLFMVVPVVSAQRADLTEIRHITEPFFKALAQKNILVSTSYQCGSNYRKDWSDQTYMRLSGKAFPWTDGSGIVHLHLFTLDPPMSLEGFRPPMTLTTADIDADGNIVVGDPGYWVRYQLWRTRPCVDFSSLLRENPKVAQAWNYWISTTAQDAHKFATQWEALGLQRDGKLSNIYSEIPVSEIQDELSWQGEPQWDIDSKWRGYDVPQEVKDEVGLEIFALLPFAIVLFLIVIGAVIKGGVPV
jgi:hypothetical protein